MTEPRAKVVEVDGQLVLVDPDAYGVASAVSKHNCKNTLKINEDRIKHFAHRIFEKNLQPKDVVIILINVDSRYGGISEALMPGHNWQEYRDRGEVPFARGLAMREGIQEFLNDVDADSAAKLKASNGIAIVVVDHDFTEVFGMLDIP